MPAERSVLVRLKANVHDFVSDMGKASASARAFTSSLDESNTRMAMLVQTALAIAPAMVPVGAAVIPVLAGIAEGATVGVTAVTTLGLAFHGIGDALTALNKYQLEPTDANFAKLQETMGELSKSGQEFVHVLDGLQPEIDQLQKAAQDGLFPGMADGLQDLTRLMPEFRRIVSETAQAMGSLAANAGDALNDRQWTEFFDYLGTEARPTVEALGRTIGHLATGLTQMMIAFDPLSSQFIHGFEDMSKSFEDWADGLSTSKSFGEFVDYIQTETPKVLGLLGDLADTFVALVKAAAPIGDVTLDVIRGLATALRAVAESPAGPVLVGTAAGLAAVSRSVALFKAANGAAMLGFLRKVKADSGTGAALGRLAAGIGGVSLAVGGLEDASKDSSEVLGTLKTTAAGALLGFSAGGPIGAAIGAGAGLVGGLAEAFLHTQDAASEAAKSYDTYIDSLDHVTAHVTNATDALVAQKLAQKGVLQQLSDLGVDTAVAVKAVEGHADAVTRINQAYKDQSRQIDAQIRQQQDIADANTTVTHGLTMRNETGEKAIQTITQLRRKQVALDESHQKLAKTLGIESDALSHDINKKKLMIDATNGVSGAMDDTAEKTFNAAAALEKLVTDADKAASALLGLSNSNIDYEQAIDDATKSLKENGKTLNIHTEKGRANQRALNAIAQAAIKHRDAMVKDGKSTEAVTKFTDKATDALSKAAQKFGMGKDKADKYAKGLLGVNTQSITTKEQIQKLNDAYDDLPTAKRTKISSPGAQPSKKKVDAFMKSLDGIPKEKRADIRTVAELSGIKAAKRAVASLHGKTVYVRTVYSAHYVSTGARQGVRGLSAYADGGIIHRADGGVDVQGMPVKREPQIAQGGRTIMWAEPETGWEAYISGKPSQQARNEAVWEEAGRRLGVQFQRFASGGLTPAPVNTPAAPVMGAQTNNFYGVQNERDVIRSLRTDRMALALQYGVIGGRRG